MKKYEFTGETKVELGVTLHRIRALIKIESEWGTVNPGDLGGWIEKEENLSHEGQAWVTDRARVTGQAWVTGQACVTGQARVTGHAWVTGHACVTDQACVTGQARVTDQACVTGQAWVTGQACVTGQAWVTDQARVLTVGPVGSRNDTTTFTRDKSGTIFVKCGCFYGTVDEFVKKVDQTHGDNKHGQVYRVCAELAKLQIDTTPCAEEGNSWHLTT